MTTPRHVVTPCNRRPTANEVRTLNALGLAFGVDQGTLDSGTRQPKLIMNQSVSVGA